MASKAIIINVEITETTYTATYSSGCKKTGSLDKMPGTVKAWIDKNQATEQKTEIEPEPEKEPEPTQLPAVTRQPVQMPLKDYGGFFWDLTTVTILPIIGAILTGTAETIRLLSWICFQLAKLAGWIQPKARKAVDMLKSYTAKTAEKIKEVAPVIVSQMRQTAESLKAWTAAAMKYRSETMKTDFTLIVKEVTQ